MNTVDVIEKVAEAINRSDHGVLVGLVEQLSKSVNGPSALRLATVFDDLRLASDGSLLTDDDQTWISEACDAASSQGRFRFWNDELAELAALNISVVACSDDGYPTNLSMVHNRPPILFIQGNYDPAVDERAVAVVGTRQATSAGVEFASKVSASLAARGVTILSGLAKGIDRAAHEAALNVDGRTLAVYGTPVTKIYPAVHKNLAQRIVSSGGACISQFLPGTSTGTWSFPIRNITMSGLSLATVVVEAGDTSGAKIQAEEALKHGKHVYLVDSLVTHQQWARDLKGQPRVTVTSDYEEILDGIESQLGSSTGVLL